jgi:hypothetical protein
VKLGSGILNDWWLYRQITCGDKVPDSGTELGVRHPLNLGQRLYPTKGSFGRRAMINSTSF